MAIRSILAGVRVAQAVAAARDAGLEDRGVGSECCAVVVGGLGVCVVMGGACWR